MFSRWSGYLSGSGHQSISFLFLILLSCAPDEPKENLQLAGVFVGTTELDLSGQITGNVPVDRTISMVFNLPVDPQSAAEGISLRTNSQVVNAEISFSSGETILLGPLGTLSGGATYTLDLSGGLRGITGEAFAATQVVFNTVLDDLRIVSLKIGGHDVGDDKHTTGVSPDLAVTIDFSAAVDRESVDNAVTLGGPQVPALDYTYSNDDKTISITGAVPLRHLSKYQFTLSSGLEGARGEEFSNFSTTFYTDVSATPQHPVVSDEELLTKVQQQTFNYFWDFAHPGSGMARERNTSGDVVTTGGSGFGVMALIVGMERKFISRSDGMERTDKILDFLEASQRFHGAWPHWLNGNTGQAIPFSINDNGGDLVETSFLVAGLLSLRQYLDEGVPEEAALKGRINALWEEVEWDWYRRGGQDVLYWHWSPTADWAMDHPIAGWNECLITYVLAAASPTHGISKGVYDHGWARDGTMKNGETFEGVVLPLGPGHGGPLFFAHYSFLGLDPRSLTDAYANYWTQNVSHTLINFRYCVNNPMKFVGHGEGCWGLTASDGPSGYSAHSPSNDRGVIAPTAALSSFPYTPEYSLTALKFFYYDLGDRLWGEYGFYDSFSITNDWYATSYIAIDQGPIIIMIENYRTGLLWELFMSAPEIRSGLEKVGFTWGN